MSRAPYTLRIIGGQWRGRKIHFPKVDAIRPTPDRVRETVFNWLQLHIANANCLDLFAGSGALGLEALSRGAKSVVFVDREKIIGQFLRDSLAQLGNTNAEVHVCESLDWLARPATPFDIVFLDPPFAAGVLERVCAALETGGWLASQAFIYLESPVGSMPQLPGNWTLLKANRAGQVGYHLARRNP